MKNYKEILVIVIIQLLLVFLRYKEIINWKWFYVLMPTWILLAIFMLILTLALYVDKYYDR